MNNEIHDEFVRPFIIEELGKPVATIEDGDVVVSFNFRPDRAIQLSRAFTDDTFDEFEPEKTFTNLKFVTFTHYSDEVVADVVFENENLEDTLGEVISKMDLHKCESQKLKNIRM